MITASLLEVSCHCKLNLVGGENMVPPLNQFTSSQILQAMGSGHHWPLAVLAMLMCGVFFAAGAATANQVLTHHAGKQRHLPTDNKIHGSGA
jgi:hypothetical protein